MTKCKYCDKIHKNNNTGCYNSGNYNSGYRNSGYRNSGHYNSGDCNSGDYNSGDCNSGDYNSGDYNSGYRNSGHYNSGDYNSGYCNSGDYNSGYRNSGHCNSGHYNSGYCNSGDHNSGLFNTNEPKMRFFNKESNLTYTEFAKGRMFYPDLKITAWVDYDGLAADEKTTAAQQMGGLLKTLTYKEAWREYWGRADEDAKEWFKSLPNFDSKIFAEITGIEVDSEVEEMTVEQICAELGRTIKIVK